MVNLISAKEVSTSFIAKLVAETGNKELIDFYNTLSSAYRWNGARIINHIGDIYGDCLDPSSKRIRKALDDIHIMIGSYEKCSKEDYENTSVFGGRGGKRSLFRFRKGNIFKTSSTTESELEEYCELNDKNKG